MSNILRVDPVRPPKSLWCQQPYCLWQHGCWTMNPLGGSPLLPLVSQPICVTSLFIRFFFFVRSHFLFFCVPCWLVAPYFWKQPNAAVKLHRYRTSMRKIIGDNAIAKMKLTPAAIANEFSTLTWGVKCYNNVIKWAPPSRLFIIRGVWNIVDNIKV